MKKMFIYEPAMCCSTGLCGVSVDPELLRLSTVISSLQKNGVEITRYNLTKAYPTNDEIISLLQVPRSYLGEQKTSAPKKNGGCNCKGGCC